MSGSRTSSWPRADRIAVLVVAVLLAAVYSPVLQGRYCLRDECLMFVDRPVGLWEFLWIATVPGWKNARPVVYPFYAVAAAAIAAGGLLWVRVVCVAAVIVAAGFFLRLLRRCGVGPVRAAALVLFLWSQPTLAIYSAYIGMSPYLLGICGAWGAYFVLEGDGRFGAWSTKRRLWCASGLLLLGWFTFQAAPFGVLVFAGYRALTADEADWPRVRHALGLALVALVSTMAIYVGSTKLMIALTPVNLTAPVGAAFSLLSGAAASSYLALLDPYTLLGPFEWWNYAFPVRVLSKGVFLGLTGVSLLVWVLAFAAALRADVGGGRSASVRARYFSALACILVVYLPVALEGLSGRRYRQHVFLALVPALLLTFDHAARVVGHRLGVKGTIQRGLQAGCLLLIAFVCIGARADLDRGIVGPHIEAQAFVEAEVRRYDGTPIDRILVVNAPETPCATEPCRGFYGATPWPVFRASYPMLFRRIVGERRGRMDFPVEFVSGSEGDATQRAGALVIDYRILQERRRRG